MANRLSPINYGSGLLRLVDGMCCQRKRHQSMASISKQEPGTSAQRPSPPASAGHPGPRWHVILIVGLHRLDFVSWRGWSQALGWSSQAGGRHPGAGSRRHISAGSPNRWGAGIAARDNRWLASIDQSMAGIDRSLGCAPCVAPWCLCALPAEAHPGALCHQEGDKS